MSQVWVVIYSEMARNKLLDASKAGRFAVANKYQSSLQAMVDKMKSTIETSGGSMPFASYDFIAMQIPVDVAEQLPELIGDYAENLDGLIGVGVGLDFTEASIAADKSQFSGEIELFDTEMINDSLEKTSDSRNILNPDVSLPVNLFDPEVPDDKPYQAVIDQDRLRIPKRMTLDESLQAEAKFLQAINEMLGAGQLQEAAEQQQQMMQQQAAQGQEEEQDDGDDSNTNTADLLGQLSGGEASSSKSSEGESDKESDQEGGDDDQEELASEVDDAAAAAQEAHKQQLVDKLQAVKEQIPQIMQLAQKDPQAFKQTMTTINKLIDSAKHVQKSELLEKAPPAMNHIRFPVGTRKGNYKKVLVNGKEVWRSMQSGQVIDQDGSEISIKAKNTKEKAKQQ